MHTVGSKSLLLVAATLLLVSGNRAVAQSAPPSWLNQAVIQKHCPTSPINASTVSAEELQQRIVISGKTLHINGTDNPDYIRVSAAAVPQFVRVAWNGYDLGPFGPVKSIEIDGNGGDDVLIVDFGVKLPAHLDGGPGDDCLQGDSAGGDLLGGPGDDVLIAGTGRPWIGGDTGNDSVVIPQPMGTLRYAPGVDSGVLRLLGQIYNLEPVSASPASWQGKPDPIILGPSDLGNEQLLDQMQQDIAAGQPVIETDATGAQLEQLRLLLNLPAPVNEPNSSQSPLAFFRREHRPGTETYDNRVGYFVSLPQQLDEWTTQLLSQVFSATAIVPKAPSGSSTNNLLNLANSYTSSEVKRDVFGNAVQILNSVWAARSFLNSADFYYVSQEADYYLSPSAPFPTFWVAGSLGEITSPTFESEEPYSLNGTSPGSTVCSTTTTSETSQMIGGTVGFSKSIGVDVSASITITDSKSISCPAIKILNLSNPSTAQAQWSYESSQRSVGLQAFSNQWIWRVPFSNYQGGQNFLTFGSHAGQLAFPSPPLEVTATPSIPLPFGQTFEVQPPVVLSVNPTCVTPGQGFAINGTGLYPSLVSGVVIGGTDLSQGLYTPVSDTLLRVVAPNQPVPNPQPVVVRTQSFSNDSISILISNSSCP